MRAQEMALELPNSAAQRERIERITEDGLTGRLSHCVTVAVEIRGRVDEEEIRTRLARVVARRPALGSVFGRHLTHRLFGGLPRFRRQELNGPNPETRWQMARDIADFEAQRPFALGEHPLVRGLLLSAEQDRHLFVLNVDQLVSDAWSANLLLDDLLQGEGQQPPEPDAYAAIWREREDWLAGPDGVAAVARRQRQLAGTALRWPVPVEPDPDAPRNVIERFVALGDTVAEALRAKVRHARGTLLAAGAMALAVGMVEDAKQPLALLTTLAGREGPAEQATVGWFANDAVLGLPARTGTVQEYATALRTEVFAALAGQRVPFELVLGALADGTADGPSVAVVFLPSGLNGGQQPGQRIGDAVATRAGVSICPTRADIDFFLLENPPPMSSTPRATLTAGVSASRDTVGAQALEHLLHRWTTALTALARVPWPSTPIADLACRVADGPVRSPSAG
jgi:hypothetical protein